MQYRNSSNLVRGRKIITLLGLIFARINFREDKSSRKIWGSAIRENKSSRKIKNRIRENESSRKLILAKINPREN